jgi:hypothetical protein
MESYHSILIMSTKLIISFVVVFILGGVMSYFVAPKIDGRFEAMQKITKQADSLTIVNEVKDDQFKSLLNFSTQNIKFRETNLRKRNENFNNDTITIPTDELIQRARAIIANQR